MKSPDISILGGGPAALAAAYFLAPYFNVHIFEKERTIGRKFLVAGKGGLNITNSKTGIELAQKYIPVNFLKDAILDFDSSSLIQLLNELGISTFEGSGGKIFTSREFKPYKILEKFKTAILNSGAEINTDSQFIGFDENINPLIMKQGGKLSLKSAEYIFALGGASWKVTGSDGKWTSLFKQIGILTKPFEPSNCGVTIRWPESILAYHSGKPLKNIKVSTGNEIFQGEAVITEYGLEGNAIYSTVPSIRENLKTGNVNIYIDLKPNNDPLSLLKKIDLLEANSSNYKSALNLNSTEMALIKAFTPKEVYFSPETFIKALKKLPIPVNSLRPIDQSISTVGGIPISEMNTDFSLKRYPNIFTIGEMVDWDAPTGGYLLQACFSMAYRVSKSIIAKYNC